MNRELKLNKSAGKYHRLWRRLVQIELCVFCVDYCKNRRHQST